MHMEKEKDSTHFYSDLEDDLDQTEINLSTHSFDQFDHDSVPSAEEKPINSQKRDSALISKHQLQESYRVLAEKYEKLKKMNRRYVQEIHRANQRNSQLKFQRNSGVRESMSCMMDFETVARDNKRLREESELLKQEVAAIHKASMNMQYGIAKERESMRESMRRSQMENEQRLRESMASQRFVSDEDVEKLRIGLLASEEKRKDLEIRVLNLLNYLKDKDIAHLHLHHLRPSRVDIVDKNHAYADEIAVLQRQKASLHDQRKRISKRHKSMRRARPIAISSEESIEQDKMRASSWPVTATKMNRISMPLSENEVRSKASSMESTPSFSNLFNVVKNKWKAFK